MPQLYATIYFIYDEPLTLKCIELTFYWISALNKSLAALHWSDELISAPLSVINTFSSRCSKYQMPIIYSKGIACYSLT